MAARRCQSDRCLDPATGDGHLNKKGRLTIQGDELWSYVGHKHNQSWIWLALDQDPREIVGVSIGSRDEDGARGRWHALPPVYRQGAVCYTDFWAAYAMSFPSKRPRAGGKETGHTSSIERLNKTLRQRISRFVSCVSLAEDTSHNVASDR